MERGAGVWNDAPEGGDEQAALLLTDLLFHDVTLLAQAHSFRASTPGAVLLAVAALGLMFREVEISGLGALCAVFLVLAGMAMVLAGPSSRRSINIDIARRVRLAKAAKHLSHFAGETTPISLVTSHVSHLACHIAPVTFRR